MPSKKLWYELPDIFSKQDFAYGGFLTNIPKLLLRFIGLVTNQFNHIDQLIKINKIAL